jgi:hypothetical protein
MVRRALPLLLAATMALPAVACGGGGGSQTVVPIAQLRADVVPNELLGLTVKREDVRARIGQVKRPFVEATGLYSLRKGKELQATLQISQFNDKADVRDPAFRLAIVNQIGSTAPRAFRMGSHTVYLTSAKRQAVAVFFERHSFAVLATLDTFDQSRALLRRLLELDL